VRNSFKKSYDLARRKAVGCNLSSDAPYVSTAETAPTIAASATMHLRQSSDPNPHWSDRARAATWFPVIDDVITGGIRILLWTTPMSKLDICMTGLALTFTRYATGGAGMSSNTSPKKRDLDEVACVFPNAAGLDIGSAEIVVAVPPDRDPEPVRVFATFTSDLHALVAWVVACGIDTVAIESTGVFWISIYELLEAAGITPYLVNARHVKIVPGRKTGWNDAQWLQKLHALGLLQASFRPDAERRTLHTLVRYRAELIERRAPHINHMIQALKHMNIQLNLMLTDITGKSGLAILRAIVATAHKIARTVYHLLKTREPYREETAAEFDQKRRERELKHLVRRDQKLGLSLTAVPDRRPEAQPEPGG
jgi:hypothetical protein